MTTASDTDDELAAIAAGDADAFARWLARCELPLRRGLRRFAGCVDTEAVLQEALLRTWQVAPRCERDDRPHGLLRVASRIARNLAISEARRHRLAPPATLACDAEPAVEPANVPDPAVRAAFLACRDKLPPSPRAAIDARIAAGRREDRLLAGAVGMQLNTFLQNVTRARAQLAECLRRAGIDVALEMA